MILAGGAGTRIGAAKHTLLFNGRTLLEHAVEKMRELTPCIIVAGSGLSVPRGAMQVPDVVPGLGPLSGIHAALLASRDDCAVVACDMPFFSTSLLDYMFHNMGSADVSAPFVGGFWEPLHAIYRQSSLPAVERLIDRTAQSVQKPKVADLFAMVRVHIVKDQDVERFGDPRKLFLNINSLDDYNAAIRLLDSGGNLQ